MFRLSFDLIEFDIHLQNRQVIVLIPNELNRQDAVGFFRTEPEFFEVAMDWQRLISLSQTHRAYQL